MAKKQTKSTLDWVVLVLVLVGAVNWGLVGALRWNVVTALFGGWAWLERLIYVLVGLAALYMAWQVSQEK